MTILNNDESKALQEIGKAAQKGFDLISGLGDFIGKVVGPAAEEVGGMLHDQAKYHRAVNLLKIESKYKEELAKRGKSEDSLRKLPFDEGYRFMEGASLEADDSVQALWAGLLASAMDPEREVKVKKFYADILKSLGPEEAAFLNILWEANELNLFKTRDVIKQFEERINEIAESTWRKFSEESRGAAIQNLVRLRCITPRPNHISVGTLFMTLQDIPRSNGFGLVNIAQFQKILEYLENAIFIASGVKEAKLKKSIPLTSIGGMTLGGLNIPEMGYLLTAAGKDLMKSCNQSTSDGKAT